MSSTFWDGLLTVCLAAVLCPTAACSETQLITDETLRLTALRTIFPGMQVSSDEAQKIDDSWPKNPKGLDLFFPDALAGETVYRVVGEASNEAERTASENMETERFSNTRQVRMKLFQWPKAYPAGLLAVVQYDFAGANPALSCPSIGLLAQLGRSAATWKVRSRYLLETRHHFSMQKIELLDLTGDGVGDLVIESSFGGAGTAGSTLQVFDLSHRQFEELLNTNSRLEYEVEEGYAQVLDDERTRQNRGQLFCVLKTILFEKGKWFDPPHVIRPCYARRYGVDLKDVRVRNEMLAPLR